MAVKVILDTDILSEYLKGHNANVAARAAAYAEEHGVFAFTSVTVFEIVYGLELKGAVGQLAKALAWLGRNEEITPTAADYRSAAFIRASSQGQGSVVEMPDCLIAAIAVRLDRPLVTGNTGDFQAIQRTGVNLVIENRRDDRPL
jgi:predicted nucleic acid-binding protein